MGPPSPLEVVMEVVMEVDQGTPPPEVVMEVVMEVDQGTPLPPEVVMEVDQGTPLPPEVVIMEVVIMEVDQGTPPPSPPLDRPHMCHLLYINWQAGGFPLKKGFLLVYKQFLFCHM